MGNNKYKVIDLTLEDMPPLVTPSQQAQTKQPENSQRRSLPQETGGISSPPQGLKRLREETSPDDQTTLIAAEARDDGLTGNTPSPNKRWQGLRRETLSPTLLTANNLQSSSRTERSIPVNAFSDPSKIADETMERRPMVVISSELRELSLAPSPSLLPKEPETDSESYQPSVSSHDSYEYYSPPASPPLSEPPNIEPNEEDEDDENEEDEEDERDEGYVELEKDEERQRSARPMQSNPELPLLGFRGYSGASFGLNSKTGFRAGAFMAVDEVPVCPNIKDRYFIDEATRHVAMDDQRPTPFISLTRNPIRAIARAFGVGRKRFTNPSLAIINLYILRDVGTLQIAECLDLKPDRKYDSRGEMLIWGEIKQPAIVSVVDVADLLSRPPATLEDNDIFGFQLLRNTWGGYFVRNELVNKKICLSHPTGFAVGQFLKMLKLPEVYHMCAITTIIRDWTFQVKKNEVWKENEEFCRGIDEGLKQSMPEKRKFPPMQRKQGKQPRGSREIISAAVVNPAESHTPSTESESDSTSSSITVTPQTTSLAKTGDTSSDAMVVDNNNELTADTKTQQGMIFTNLPETDETEFMDYEEPDQAKKSQLDSLTNPLAYPLTLEIEILIRIHDSLTEIAKIASSTTQLNSPITMEIEILGHIHRGL